MSGDNMEQWLKRFRASDAQEEEPVDHSAGYRALLGQTSEPKPKARAQPETGARTARS